MYRIGMDGGGTRTRLVVIEREQECFRLETGGINYNSFSKEEIRDSLDKAVYEVKGKGFLPEDCEGIGIGAAGISNPEAAPFLTKVLRDLGFTCPIRVVGDQEAALVGALGKRAGILLIAGTGSICMAQDGKGDRYRVGGCGHIIDDAGSAYAVGRDILNAIVRAEDGRGCFTAMAKSVYNILGIKNSEQLIAYIYDTERTKKDIAAIATCLSEELIRTDEVAREVARKAARELALHIEAILPKLPANAGEQLPLILEGGLILKNGEVNRLFREFLEKKKLPVYVAEKERDAAYGAAFLI